MEALNLFLSAIEDRILLQMQYSTASSSKTLLPVALFLPYKNNITVLNGQSYNNVEIELNEWISSFL